MARFTRWLMVGSVVASSIAAPTAEACWLTGCCGGAPRTTFYAPAPVAVAPACPAPCAAPTACNACEASPCNTCNTGVAATTFAPQPTTALMPVTTYRPWFGWGRTQPVVATMPYTAGYAAAAPYSAGYTPYTAGYAAAPYTSYRPIALTPTSYAAPVSYTAPVTVQYAPQPVAQAAYYAPATTVAPTTTYMPTTTVAPAPVAAPAPGCNCHSSNTNSPSGQYWTPNSTTAVVQTAPITTGTITSGTVTNGAAVMTSGSNTTFGNTNLGTQGVLQNAPQQAPVNNNVQPVEDPIKKSSNTVPSYEDPRNKTALLPLFDNSQVAETKTNNAPMVRSLDELAPYNPVRMTSNVR